MELVLAAIAAGGLVGASNQYACLLVLSIAARLGVVQLAEPMQFMASFWFMGLAGFLWLITIAPAFSSHLAPGVMHAINAVVHFISGFVVPVSSALIGLAAVGVIVNLDPELRAALDTLRIFNGESGIGGTGLLIAGGSAATAVALTGMKALAKPLLSTASGTAGTASAPAFAIAENIAAVVLMALAYTLSQIDPWLLVGLLGVVVLISLVLFGLGLYQLWRLKKGIGRVLYLLQAHPRAGLSICVEFFVWGLGWLVWKNVGRGAVSLLAWLVWLAVFISIQPIVTAVFVFFPPLIPVALLSANFLMVALFVGLGLGSAGALMKTLEKDLPPLDAPRLATA
jgi:hypothetical protein